MIAATFTYRGIGVELIGWLILLGCNPAFSAHGNIGYPLGSGIVFTIILNEATL